MNKPKRTVRNKVLGERCPICKRIDVEFYAQSSYCKTCASAKVSARYKERYWSDPEFRQRQLDYKKQRNEEAGHDLCACGELKSTKADTCWDCFSAPSPVCVRCGNDRDDTFKSNQCGECIKLGQKESLARPGVKVKLQRKAKIRDLFKKYGLTIEEYEAILESQNYVCAICATHEWGPRGPQVDHDHTKQGRESVRGILCTGCNWALGKLGDNAHAVAQAHDYLLRYENRVDQDLIEKLLSGPGRPF